MADPSLDAGFTLYGYASLEATTTQYTSATDDHGRIAGTTRITICGLPSSQKRGIRDRPGFYRQFLLLVFY